MAATVLKLELGNLLGKCLVMPPREVLGRATFGSGKGLDLCIAGLLVLVVAEPWPGNDETAVICF